MSLNGRAAILIYALLYAVQTPPPQPQSTPPNPQKPASPPSAPRQSDAAPQNGTGQPSSATSPTPPMATVFDMPELKKAAQPAGVTAEPNPCLPGQTVIFYLPDRVKRAAMRGGHYTRMQELKPHELISDTPKRSTTYTFDLLLEGEGGTDGKAAAKPAQHQQYNVIVDVLSGAFPRLTTYHNPQRWSIDTVIGWIRNVIPQEDPATEALIYFQPEDDSPERISVAVTPVKNTSCAALMKTALMDAPTQYDVFEHIQQKETTQCGVSAIWATFDGVDHALPGMPTKSMVLAFVRDGVGYVISGRARASRYDQWEKLLHSLVRSFAIEPEVSAKPGT